MGIPGMFLMKFVLLRPPHIRFEQIGKSRRFMRQFFKRPRGSGKKNRLGKAQGFGSVFSLSHTWLCMARKPATTVSNHIGLTLSCLYTGAAYRWGRRWWDHHGPSPKLWRAHWTPPPRSREVVSTSTRTLSRTQRRWSGAGGPIHDDFCDFNTKWDK